MSTNANSTYESTLHIMIKTYQDKEKRWMEEKRAMRNEMIWLKEELKAIRSFILTDKAFPTSFASFNKQHLTPVPAFIRAWQVSSYDSEGDDKNDPCLIKPDTTQKSLERRSGPPYYFITPEMSNKKQLPTKYFYPVSIDNHSPVKYHVVDNFHPFLASSKPSEASLTNHAQKLVSSTKGKHLKHVSKFNWDMKGQTLYNMSATSLSFKKHMKSSERSGSNHEARSLF